MRCNQILKCGRGKHNGNVAVVLLTRRRTQTRPPAFRVHLDRVTVKFSVILSVKRATVLKPARVISIPAARRVSRAELSFVIIIFTINRTQWAPPR